MVIWLSALGGSEKMNQGCALQNKIKSTEEGTKKQREESSRNPCFEFYFEIFEFTIRYGEGRARVGRQKGGICRSSIIYLCIPRYIPPKYGTSQISQTNMLYR